MSSLITTSNELQNLVNLDSQTHKLKDIAQLFLDPMNDWPTINLKNIPDFIRELKEFYGNPLTVDSITKRKFDSNNAWQLESGSIIINVIELSTLYFNINNFDTIVENILKYYSK
ncbi:MAG: hypothetical protein JST20_00360 [Bacteroidetes bacterium]|nr:hypothetical protein [Bacteroidota bacterium]